MARGSVLVRSMGLRASQAGRVTVESKVGQGATFSIVLPRSSKAPERSREERIAPTKLREGEGCVLVVEDNRDVGEFSTQLLGDLGYRTMFAPDAPSALALLHENPSGFDLVFSDVMMPGMNGIEFGNEVRKLWPQLPFVLTSGYSEVLAREGAHKFPLLQKPYSVEDLSRILRQALGAEVQKSAAPGGMWA